VRIRERQTGDLDHWHIHLFEEGLPIDGAE